MFDKHKGKKPNHTRVTEPGLTSSPGASGSATAPTMKNMAVIGPGIVIQGDISGSENLLVEGKVKGKIKLSSNEVTVGQSGVVNADVSAKIVRVAGKVNGDICGSEKVMINSTGHVTGNIVAPRMTLEDGAIFKGSIDMDPGEPAPAKAVAPAATSHAQPGKAPELVSKPAKKAPDLALKSG